MRSLPLFPGASYAASFLSPPSDLLTASVLNSRRAQNLGSGESLQEPIARGILRRLGPQERIISGILHRRPQIQHLPQQTFPWWQIC